MFAIYANYYIFWLITWPIVLCGCALPWLGYRNVADGVVPSRTRVGHRRHDHLCHSHHDRQAFGYHMAHFEDL
ncbi:hypothetical protein TELCIR_18757 [Teladorsagia circumcincta]|uniref:Uncharacterized protein n=1 Tax=Teladorsagia circumcincta TaxID=45464 RepID=A0A2G9TPA7_TELCI|nr:hypothetical protein TELCIR_18757 [Teladorsagia circumcincta]